MKELSLEQKESIRQTTYIWLEKHFYKVKEENKRYVHNLIAKQADELTELISDNIIFRESLKRAREILSQEGNLCKK